ncbi:MAG: hypothetical protein SNJ71_05750, partial [Bacteroidales bacterium]
MKNKFIQTIVLSILAITAYSQTYYGPKHMEEILTKLFKEHITNTPIIIEGRVHSFEKVLRLTDTTQWIIKFIEIKRVLKGHEYGIQSGRIALVQKNLHIPYSKENIEAWKIFIEQNKKPTFNYLPYDSYDGENIYFLDILDDETIPKEVVGKSDNTIRVKQFGDTFTDPYFVDAFIDCKGGDCGIYKF